MENQNEIEELKEIFIKEADKLRDSLLDNLFNLNAILSAAFLFFLQKDDSSIHFKILNSLPFISVTLIMVYKLGLMRSLGHIYHNIENWDKEKSERFKNLYQNVRQLILFTIILTLIEIGYLLSMLLF